MTEASKVRESTDQSLRVERDRADAAVDARLEKVEVRTDQAMHASREVADAVTQAARDEADLGVARSRGEAGAVGAARSREDVAIDQQRQVADAATLAERQERKRSMEAFLATERGKTDEDLVDERGLADTLVASRDEFLANVSHDLRSLLGGLALTAGLLAKGASPGEEGAPVRKLGEAAARYVVRMDRLVSDLQDIASIEAGRLAMFLGSAPVSGLLRDTVSAFEPVAAAKRITLRAEPAGGPAEVRLDDQRILQVLANLVSNAIKFTPEGGEVRLAVTASGPEVHFTVQDSGVGIPADQLERVFDRFRQVSKDRRGLGIGLHISKCIVEAHGGRLWAASQPGAGSTFHFVLPA